MDQPTAPHALDSWPAHVAMAVATGVATTYLPVQRWSRAARWSLHGGMGALTGIATAFAMRNPELLRTGDGDAQASAADDAEAPATRAEPRKPSSPAVTAAVALGATAAVAGVSRGGQAFDAWAERSLTRRGVRRPRLWMGVVAGGASLAMSVADRRRDERGLTD
jgi:hypothetical protein